MTSRTPGSSRRPCRSSRVTRSRSKDRWWWRFAVSFARSRVRRSQRCCAGRRCPTQRGETCFYRCRFAWRVSRSTAADRDETCAGGTCQPAKQDEGQLVDFRDDLVFGTAAGDTCFSEETCLADSVFVPLAEDTTDDVCEIQLPEDAPLGQDGRARVNVSVQWAVAPERVIALDAADPVEGWTFAGERRLRLSKGVCLSLRDVLDEQGKRLVPDEALGGIHIDGLRAETEASAVLPGERRARGDRSALAVGDTFGEARQCGGRRGARADEGKARPQGHRGRPVIASRNRDSETPSITPSLPTNETRATLPLPLLLAVGASGIEPHPYRVKGLKVVSGGNEGPNFSGNLGMAYRRGSAGCW